MERFPDELDCRKLNGEEWLVLEPFRYRSKLIGTVIVPRGFVTDLTSVPWFARWYVARDGEHTKPAVIHDFLYTLASVDQHPEVDQKLADQVFREALLVRGIRSTQASVLYAAVRIGGGRTFRDD